MSHVLPLDGALDFEVERMRKRIAELEAENARMRAALNQLTDEGVDDWIAALAKIALDGNTTLST